MKKEMITNNVEKELPEKPPEKLSMEQLIAHKANIKIKNKVEYFSKELNGIIEIVKPSRAKFFKIIAQTNETSTLEEATEMQSELIYECVPMFQNFSLHEAYGIKDPFDIVLAVLNDNLDEFQKIASVIFKFYKINTEKLVDIKKQSKKMENSKQ